MAEPAVQLERTEFEKAPNRAPVLEVIPGGGETSPPIGNLEAVDGTIQEEADPYPNVIKVSDMEGDAELVAKAQRNIKTRLVGGLAVDETVQADKKPIKNTAESIIWASRGDAEGNAMLSSNIGTEMREQAYKAGDVITIRLQVDDDDIYQHGQRMSDVQRNAYQLASDDPVIRPRTEAEANNVPRMKRLYDAGLLEDNVYVRFSMCAEDVPDEKLDELNFFSSTKSMSVQAAYSENGQLFDEVAMVAGVKEKGGERHDRRMVERFARLFGHSYEGMSVPEILNDGMMIPKKYIKDGVVDIVRIMEEDEGTFFGRDVPKQDYGEYKEFCEQRAVRFDEDVASVRKELIAEKDKLITGRELSEANMLATRRLSKLVEQKLVDRAFSDLSIEPEVFGEESAQNLIRARELSRLGEHHEAQAFMQVARATAKGGSCPAALLKIFGGEIAESAAVSKENAWAGTDKPARGTCVNCNKRTKVGVKNWCKGCIKGHCG